MINEKELKEFLYYLMVWTEIGNKPDVKKMLVKRLNKAINSEKTRKVK